MGKQFGAERAPWMAMFEVPYVVKLVGWPDLPVSQRAVVETRFATELASRFGSPEAVKRAFSAREDVVDPVLAPRSQRMSAWWSAEKAAKTAALRGFDPPPGATFWISLYDQGVSDAPGES